MVLAGEPHHGYHHLAEAMHHLEELLLEDWQLSQRVGWHDGRPSLIIDRGLPAPSEWATLSSPEQLITLTLFCRTIGMLLSSGIALSGALTTASHLLPAQQQQAVIAAAQMPEQSEVNKALSAAGFLPKFITILLLAGQAADALECTMNRAADTFHAEITGVR